MNYEFLTLCWCGSAYVDSTPRDVQRGLTEPCDDVSCLEQALQVSTTNKHGEAILRRPHVARKFQAKRNHPRLKGRM
jgi:hypothetical protein